MFVDLRFPELGLDESKGYAQQQPGTTVEALNVRAKEPVTGRRRGGSRAGLSKFISDRANEAKVQCLGIVVHTDDDALAGAVDMWGGSGDSGGLGYVLGDDFVTDPVTGRQVPAGGTGYLLPPTSKKTPDITWADPAHIYAGTALSGAQLNAAATDPDDGSPVAGTFTYSPASGTVLLAGNDQVLNALFVPTDTTTYYSAADTAEIDVLPLGNAIIDIGSLGAGPIGVNWSIRNDYAITVGTGVTVPPDSLAAATWTVNDAASVSGGALVAPSSLSAATWSINAPTVSTTSAFRVQECETTTTSGTTIACTWPGSTTTNNLLVGVFTGEHASSNPNLAVPAGWTILVSSHATGACGSPKKPSERRRSVLIAYKANAASESATGNFTMTSGTSVSLMVAEYSITVAAPADKSNSGRGSSTTPSTGSSGTLAQADELVVAGYCGDGAQTFSSPTGVTTIVNQATDGSSNQSGCMCEIHVAATTAVTGGITQSSSACWVAVIGTFKAS